MLNALLYNNLAGFYVKLPDVVGRIAFGVVVLGVRLGFIRLFSPANFRSTKRPFRVNILRMIIILALALGPWSN
jgi:hypothetical protein